MSGTRIAFHCAAGALVALPLCATFAAAEVVNVPASKDAMIFGTAANADTNNASGKGPAMFAGADGSSNRKRGLMQFDIAATVPAGAQITNVTLTLYLAQVAGSGAGGAGGNVPQRTLNLFDLQQDWGEGTSGSPTSPGVGGTGQGYPRVTGDSSWDYAIYNSADTTAGKWNAGGPDLHGGNFSSTAAASSTFNLPYNLNTAYTWSSAGMVADVQAWLNAPSNNHGWLLKAMSGLDANNNPVDIESTPTSFLGFWTKDGAAANNNPNIAPVLSVTYVVPEPSGFSLLLLSVASVVARRCRKPFKA